MGTCLASEILIHPVLGPTQLTEINQIPLIKLQLTQIDHIQLSEFETNITKLKQTHPHAQDYLFLPISYHITPTCSLNPFCEFYFQNYDRNSSSPNDSYLGGPTPFTQNKIKEIGKFLFEFWEKDIDSDEEFTIQNLIFTSEGKVKIVLKKYLPFPQDELLYSRTVNSKKSKFSEDTDCSNSARQTLTNSEYRKRKNLDSICTIILDLIKDHCPYSHGAIIDELKSIHKNEDTLVEYFVGKGKKVPKNFFLDAGYIEQLNDISHQSSVFLVSETDYDFN